MDIQTTIPPANAFATRLPFDWQVVGGATSETLTRHDFSNPCAAPTHQAEVLATYGLAVETGLHTAVILSLFIDRRAGPDDVLPHNQTDRRGWCGDEYMRADDLPVATGVDPWGSHLWLCYFTKVDSQVLERARFAAWEALQWMVTSDVAARVAVSAEWRRGTDYEYRLALRVQIYQPDTSNPVYDVLWGTTIARGQS